MQDKYVIATADINNERKEFYREGKRDGFYLPKHYTSLDLKSLQSDINQNMHLIRHKFRRLEYFYSDAFNFCKFYLPEVICDILGKEMKIKMNTCGQGNDFIVYTDKRDYPYARDRYNEHFHGNLI